MKNKLKRKLRIRFVLLATVSLLLVQCVIVGVSIYHNHQDLVTKSDMLISQLHNNPSGATNCYNSGTIKIDSGVVDLGGLFGFVSLSVPITKCVNVGNITVGYGNRDGKYNVGGISGDGGVIYRCWNSGNISAVSNEELPEYTDNAIIMDSKRQFNDEVPESQTKMRHNWEG